VRNLANFAMFQGVWLAAVLGAARGHMHLGLAAAGGMLAVHLATLDERSLPARLRELGYVVAAGLAGTLLDGALGLAGWIRYPTSAPLWALPTPPPWILGLWLAFAMLPRYSLRWLRPWPALAALLGALGGPLSFLAGARLGAIAPGSHATYPVLALEYAVLVPLLLYLAPAPRYPKPATPQPSR
jgi:hypothetical protein